MDGKILIKTGIDLKGAKEDLQRLRNLSDSTAKHIEELNSTVSSQSAQKTALEQSLERAKRRVLEVQQDIERMSSELRSSDTADPWGLAHNLTEAKQVLEETVNSLFPMQEQLNNLTASLQENEAELQRETAALEQTSAAADRLATRINIVSRFKGAIAGIGAAATGAFSKATTFLGGFLKRVVLGNKLIRTLRSRLFRLSVSLLIFNAMSKAITSVVSNVTALAMKNTALQQSLANLKGAGSQLAAVVSSVLAPAFTFLANALAVAVQFIVKLFSLITGKSLSSIKSMAKGLSSVGSSAKNASSSLASFDTISQLKDNSSSAGASSDSVAPNYDFEAPNLGWMDTMAENLASLFEMFSQFWNNIKEFFEPAVKLIQEVWAGMVKGIKDAWAEYGEPLMAEFSALFQNIGDLVLNVFNTILKPIWDNLILRLGELWRNWLQPLWTEIVKVLLSIGQFVLTLFNTVLIPQYNKLVNIFGPTIRFVINSIVDAVAWAVSLISGCIEIVLRVFRGLLDFVTNILKGNWDAAMEGLATTVDDVWAKIKRVFKLGVNGIIGFINKMISAIVEGVNTCIRALNEMSFDIPDWIPKIGGKRFGFDINEVTAPKIPYLAQGAVIPPNREFMAVLGDQSSGTNIEAPLATIEQAVRNVVGQQNVNIRFSGSLAQLGRVLRPVIEKENSRVGSSLVVGGGVY